MARSVSAKSTAFGSKLLSTISMRPVAGVTAAGAPRAAAQTRSSPARTPAPIPHRARPVTSSDGRPTTRLPRNDAEADKQALTHASPQCGRGGSLEGPHGRLISSRETGPLAQCDSDRQQLGCTSYELRGHQRITPGFVEINLRAWPCAAWRSASSTPPSSSGTHRRPSHQ